MDDEVRLDKLAGGVGGKLGLSRGHAIQRDIGGPQQQHAITVQLPLDCQSQPGQHRLEGLPVLLGVQLGDHLVGHAFLALQHHDRAGGLPLTVLRDANGVLEGIISQDVLAAEAVAMRVGLPVCHDLAAVPVRRQGELRR